MYKTSVEQLKNIPLFTFVEDDELALIAEKLELKTFPENTLIIKEGDAGNCLYLLKSGRVKVFAQHQDLDQEIVLSYLESGDHFGEMALISGDPRSASVLSVTEVEAWELNRDVFDTLIVNNPSITLTLTHLLTQRLKESNIARKATEEYYKQKFTPHGNLKDTDVINLLKYAEENSLSGILIFEKGKDEAQFHYSKGQLVKLEFDDKEEDEAMDIILEWHEGTYKIEPSILKPEAKLSVSEVEDKVKENKAEKATAKSSEKQPDTDDELTIIRKYLEEKLSDFVHFAGAKITQRALNRSYHNFEKFFDNIYQIKISIIPEISIELNTDKWSDKLTLLLAVLIRDIIEAFDRDVIGMMFWSPRSSDDKINTALEELQYFEYYEQSMDLIKG
jgi:CRP-like cAMP-binding protein